MKKKMISPSMMCAGLAGLEKTLKEMEENKTEYLHMDVMDGLFVPNYALGTDYCRMIREMTDIPFDYHLMIERPEEKIDWFDVREGDIVSVHAESTHHIQKALSIIRSKGALAFAALNPGTPLCALDEILDDVDGILIMSVNPGFAGQKAVPGCFSKIERARKLVGEEMPIEVDGNVSIANAAKMSESGANIFVAGTSSVFRRDMTLTEGIEIMRKAVSRGDH